MKSKRGMGTVLRALVYQMDQGLDSIYAEMGLSFRSKYFPVFQYLYAHETSAVGDLVESSGLSYPALSQVIHAMKKDGLLETEPSENDKRQQILRLTPEALKLRPKLESVWRALPVVHEELSRECGVQLPDAFTSVLETLEKRSFKDRLRSQITN